MTPLHDEPHAEWPGRRLSAGDADLFVRDTGTGHPAVVFLHGLGGHAGEWWPVASLLRDSHRVVAFDQRGQGRSTNEPTDLGRDAFVQDAVTVIEHVDAGPVVLVGQSMGAHTALLTAARRPDLVSSLVLVEGGLGGEGAEASHEVVDWFHGWPVPFDDPDAAAAWFEGQGYRPDAARAWAAGLRSTPAGLVPRFRPEVLLEQLLAVHLEARQREWKAVACPALLVKGGHGFIPMGEFDRMLATNPGTRFVEVDDAGHDVHLDAPGRVAELVRAHIHDGHTRGCAPRA